VGFADKVQDEPACSVLVSAFNDFKPAYLAQSQFSDSAPRPVFDQFQFQRIALEVAFNAESDVNNLGAGK
jgi:hypothetical protein